MTNHSVVRRWSLLKASGCGWHNGDSNLCHVSKQAGVRLFGLFAASNSTNPGLRLYWNAATKGVQGQSKLVVGIACSKVLGEGLRKNLCTENSEIDFDASCIGCSLPEARYLASHRAVENE